MNLTSTDTRDFIAPTQPLEAYSALLKGSLVLSGVSTSSASFTPTTIANADDKPAKLKDILNSYLGLREGWDGYEGITPTNDAVNQAQQFVDRLLEYNYDYRLPKPMLSSDGEVGFYWDVYGCYLSIEFEEDGSFYFYGRDEIGHECSGEEKVLPEIPTSLRRLLHRINFLEKVCKTSA